MDSSVQERLGDVSIEHCRPTHEEGNAHQLLGGADEDQISLPDPSLPSSSSASSTSHISDSSSSEDEESEKYQTIAKRSNANMLDSTPKRQRVECKAHLQAEEELAFVALPEKLMEMGEISVKAVKKGDKKKTSPQKPTEENEVTITPALKKTGDEDLSAKNKGSGAHLRKNIREVMDETKLDECTLAAQRQEAERLQRVQQQQNLLRELQRQAAQERMQNKVLSLLQGASCATQLQAKNVLDQLSSVTRIGSTYLTKVSPPNASCTSAQPRNTLLAEQLDAKCAPVKHARFNSAELAPSISIAPVPQHDKPPVMTAVLQAGTTSAPPCTEPSSGSSSTTLDNLDPIATIDISSDEDCIVLSESEDDNEDTLKDDDESEGTDPNNSGMHTNDQFNRPDAEGRVLINVGHPDTDQDIFIAPQIARVVKPHQIGGVRFLYDNVVESTARFDTSTGFGCILAHSMGLGKTLQVICFTEIFLRNTSAKTVLIIMPINTLQNWVAEYNMWTPLRPINATDEQQATAIQYRTFNLFVLNDSHKTLSARTSVVNQWYTDGGVLLIGYEQFRLLSQRRYPQKSRKKSAIIMDVMESETNQLLFDAVHEALIKPGPDLVICDEGHRIKNSHASISKALKQIRTKRRVVLTGYPLQNNLMEYWCMVDFVRPNYLGTKSEFCNMFERPIMNGQCIDSTSSDIKLMRYRAHVLHSLLLGFVQRRSHAVLQVALPRKEEYVLLVRMLPFQRQLYETFMDQVVRPHKDPNPLRAFAVCCKIWNHPDVLYNFIRKKARGDTVDIDLEEDTTTSVTTNCTPGRKPAKNRKKCIVKTDSSSSSSTSNDVKPKINIISDVIIPPPPIETKDPAIIDDDLKLKHLDGGKLKIEDTALPYDWAVELLKDYVPACLEQSAKMVILFCILRESIKLGDRLLVFSQSLITLDIIEQFLNMYTVQTDGTEKWCKNGNYYRLDGSTSALERERLINTFNVNPEIYLFLVSTRAGSLGVNLIGANRVVVFDASWNPCHDTQAVCRVYRYGQQKPCFVYRLVVDNCLEKKIYDRQINKQGMSDRVVDECNPDAHLTMKDVTAICWDEQVDETKENDWSHVKDTYNDVVLRRLIENYGTRLNKEPFQHESLLVDRKETQLSQQEKRLAKKSYERDKQAARQPLANYYFPGSAMTPTGGRFEYFAASGVAVNQRPVASVRPMQHQQSPRWVPAEQWQRHGMSAQEMILPMDVVIPTIQPDRGNITLKAGQKVLILKSPKGVYMQLESGKIVSIKTSMKAKDKGGEEEDPFSIVQQAQQPYHKHVPMIPQKMPTTSLKQHPLLSSTSTSSVQIPATVGSHAIGTKPLVLNSDEVEIVKRSNENLYEHQNRSSTAANSEIFDNGSVINGNNYYTTNYYNDYNFNANNSGSAAIVAPSYEMYTSGGGSSVGGGHIQYGGGYTYPQSYSTISMGASRRTPSLQQNFQQAYDYTIAQQTPTTVFSGHTTNGTASSIEAFSGPGTPYEQPQQHQFSVVTAQSQPPPLPSSADLYSNSSTGNFHPGFYHHHHQYPTTAMVVPAGGTQPPPPPPPPTTTPITNTSTSYYRNT